jgi:hypothetical protein|tara:strand:+ start:838 stop:1074 length:237 start_codon:yes stop_codon:yes gene_type:complete
MPVYRVKRRDVKDSNPWEVRCSYQELQEMCEEYKLEQCLSTPNFVTSTGNMINKTDNGWKDHLGEIKKGSGKGNTIKL